MRKQALLLMFMICVSTVHQIIAQESTSSDDTDQSAERHEFQAEVGRLMDIIINSLYTQKEIFLRELISNASDALDKMRFLSVSDPEALGENSELRIDISYDEESKTLSIQDSGVGMTKQDLINNLGTVAKSGTTNFIEAIKGGSLNLIGQFGVGFYSTFLAATKVTVVSKHNDDNCWQWESSAAHSFTIKQVDDNSLKRGTRVVLHLKQDAYEFSQEDVIRQLVKKYSEFINFPIYLRVRKEVEREVQVEEENDEAKPEENNDQDDLKVEDEAEVKQDKPKTKKVKETTYENQQLNENKALWLRDKSEIDDEEYEKFYKSISKEYDAPAGHIHFKAEGEVEFKSILYIPKNAPYTQFENYYGKSSSIKLYVRRVLIAEEFDELVPRYLNFIKGVVDSDDLPLNVSRESLQQLKMMKVISRKLVRKCIEMMGNLSKVQDDDDDEEDDDDEDDDEEKTEKTQDADDDSAQQKKAEAKQRYDNFFKQFGKNVKLGIIEDPGNRAKLSKLTRWYSTHNTTEYTSLDEYISRAKPGQDYIYYLAGETKEKILESPTLQALLKKGYEVLILDDPLDEYVFSHLNEYEKKKLSNVGKGEFKFPDDDDSSRRRQKKLKKMFSPLIDWWKVLLSDQLENVVISQRLVNDPCVIVSSEHGQSANMERLQKAQTHSNRQHESSSRKLLEINPSHPIIKELLERVKDADKEDKESEELAILLTETAMINSGFNLKNTSDFANRFYKLFNGAMGIPKDAPVEDIEFTNDDDEEEEQVQTPQDYESDVNQENFQASFDNEELVMDTTNNQNEDL